MKPPIGKFAKISTTSPLYLRRLAKAINATLWGPGCYYKPAAGGSVRLCGAKFSKKAGKLLGRYLATAVNDKNFEETFDTWIEIKEVDRLEDGYGNRVSASTTVCGR